MAERKISNHYPGLDAVRVIAIVGIVLMHVLSNGDYGLKGFLFEKIIGTAGNFTILFMMVSAFGMCCGYYERFKDRSIEVETFYKRRYEKMWPFFALLCVLDVAVSPSENSLYEVFANLTLVQGLLPNPQISVVGVSWTLAVIFVFYLLFPFFCFLLGSKRRAWIGMIIAGIYNVLCQLYFFDKQHVLNNFIERENILYSSVFFMAGGLIYLYRDRLRNLKNIRIVASVLLMGTAFTYYFFSQNDLFMASFSIAIIIFAITSSGKIVNSKYIKKMSSISFEVYLSHMVIYRALEKLHIVHLFSNGLLAYIFTTVAVICGSVVFSVCANWFLNKIKTLIVNRRVNHV